MSVPETIYTVPFFFLNPFEQLPRKNTYIWETTTQHRIFTSVRRNLLLLARITGNENERTKGPKGSFSGAYPKNAIVCGQRVIRRRLNPRNVFGSDRSFILTVGGSDLFAIFLWWLRTQQRQRFLLRYILHHRKKNIPNSNFLENLVWKSGSDKAEFVIYVI